MGDGQHTRTGFRCGPEQFPHRARMVGAAAESGAGVLAITHDLESLLDSEVCDEIAVMRAGTVVSQGPTAEIVASTDEYLRAFFAGVRA